MPANLPNVLTVSRIVAIPLVCGLMAANTDLTNWLALALYVFACVTDFLDGYLARSWDQQSGFGRMLDPIADKLLVASLLLMLVGTDRLHGAAILPAGIILCREILVSGLREYLATLRVPLPVTRLAKWKTTVQMVALGILVVGDSGPRLGEVTLAQIGVVGLWIAAALTVYTGYDYLRAGIAHAGTTDDGYPATAAINPVKGDGR